MLNLAVRRHRPAALAIYVALSVLALLFIAPIVWMLLASFKTTAQVVAVPVQWWTWPPTFANYPDVFAQEPLARYFANSFFLAVVNVLGVLFSGCLVAYSFSRLRWPGRNLLFAVMLSTVLLPGSVTLIPVYLIWRTLRMTNTYWPLTLPSFFGSPFFIFLLRQFFLSIPQELSDAARVDGANELRIMLRIVAPLAVPALAAISVFTFIGTWEDFLNPLIYLDDPNLLTMALGLQRFLGAHTQEWSTLMAGVVIFVAPILVVFVLAQRLILEGITFTGVTGT
jgi:ABC-type glycerol-3-phosphate transport system permease component